MRPLWTGLAVFGCTAMLMAQTTPPQTTAPTQPAATGTKVNTYEPITVTGCVVLESDYRQSAERNVARDQFVLTDTALATAAVTAAPGSPQQTITVERVYQLTGAFEASAGKFLHQRVEIAGMSNPTESSHATPTPGATVNGPPVLPGDTTRPLPELEVMTVKQIPGECAVR